MIKSSAFIVPVLLVGSLVMPGCATVKTHPDFAARHKEMHTIQLVPPDIDAYEITFNAGNQPLPAALQAMETGTQEQVKVSLTEKGYQYHIITSSELNSNPQLKSALFEMQSLYKKAIEDITANRKKSFTYSVGSSPNAFADYKPAEAILLFKEEAWTKSQGQVTADVTKALGVAVATLGMYTPPMYFKQTAAQVALVDINLGDILWYNVNININGTEPTNQNDVMKFIKDIIKPLPNCVTRGGVVAATKKKAEPARTESRAAAPNNFARSARA